MATVERRVLVGADDRGIHGRPARGIVNIVTLYGVECTLTAQHSEGGRDASGALATMTAVATALPMPSLDIWKPCGFCSGAPTKATRTEAMDDMMRIVEEERKRQQLLRDAGVIGPAADILRIEREVRDMGPYLQNATEAARHMDHMRDIQRDFAEAREAPTARRAVRNIAARIRAFVASLDQASEVGLKLVSFGGSTVVHIREVDYEQPNLIFFRGNLDDGSPVELIQNLTQLSFLLVQAPRLEPDKPRPVIGFNLGHESEDETE